MITISKAYSFDSAHQLRRSDWDDKKNEEVFGKCSRVHGHTYKLEVYVRGEINNDTGMVLNYFILDMIVKPLVERLDHQNLNEVFEKMLTTSENMVSVIASWLHDELFRYPDVVLHQVTLQETPKTKAVWVP